MNTPHLSVLKEEILAAFADCSLKEFIDGTLGAGGHAKALLSVHPEIMRLIAIDQDPEAMAIAQAHLQVWQEKIDYRSGNFETVIAELFQQGVKVDGILLDLGVSSMQLDRAEKGFSFMHEGPLDMRMDPRAPLTAEEIVNCWSEAEIARIIRDYGEEKYWKIAARAIVTARAAGPIQTTKQLADILCTVIWRKKGKNIHPATLTFQALRICVNRELEVIENTIPLCIDLLNPGGRLAVITFHSLEDRIVKNLFRFSADDKYDTSGLAGVFLDKTPKVKLWSRKAIVPTEEEIAVNSRSRSAKLRVVEKI